MKVIIENSANNSINDIFYYNILYSIRNAINVDTNIKICINELETFPYIR